MTNARRHGCGKKKSFKSTLYAVLGKSPLISFPVVGGLAWLFGGFLLGGFPFTRQKPPIQAITGDARALRGWGSLGAIFRPVSRAAHLGSNRCLDARWLMGAASNMVSVTHVLYIHICTFTHIYIYILIYSMYIYIYTCVWARFSDLVKGLVCDQFGVHDASPLLELSCWRIHTASAASSQPLVLFEGIAFFSGEQNASRTKLCQFAQSSANLRARAFDFRTRLVGEMTTNAFHSISQRISAQACTAWWRGFGVLGFSAFLEIKQGFLLTHQRSGRFPSKADSGQHALLQERPGLQGVEPFSDITGHRFSKWGNRVATGYTPPQTKREMLSLWMFWIFPEPGKKGYQQSDRPFQENDPLASLLRSLLSKVE